MGMRCRRHPYAGPPVGVCSGCLRDRLLQLSAEDDPNSYIPALFSSHRYPDEDEEDSLEIRDQEDEDTTQENRTYTLKELLPRSSSTIVGRINTASDIHTKDKEISKGKKSGSSSIPGSTLMSLFRMSDDQEHQKSPKTPSKTWVSSLLGKSKLARSGSCRKADAPSLLSRNGTSDTSQYFSDSAMSTRKTRDKSRANGHLSNPNHRDDGLNNNKISRVDVVAVGLSPVNTPVPAPLSCQKSPPPFHQYQHHQHHHHHMYYSPSGSSSMRNKKQFGVGYGYGGYGPSLHKFKGICNWSPVFMPIKINHAFYSRSRR